MHKNILSIVFPAVFILVSVISVIQDSVLSISNAILAITALILLWYSDETARMRKEMVKQNMMVMRPVMNLKLHDKKVYYKNDGSGPALNIRVHDFNPTLLIGTPTDNTASYDINPISYIAQNHKEEMLIYRGNRETKAINTVPDTDMFFGVGKQVQLTIRYTDIEGTKYETKITTDSGEIRCISFKRLQWKSAAF